MSECRLIAVQLTSYVDDLLGPDERAQIEQHLHLCASCRTVAAGERGGRTVLRHQAPRLLDEPLPPGLRSRCDALARECGAQSAAKATRFAGLLPGWPRSLVPTVLSVVLLVFTASAIFSLATRRSDALLAAQLTADHTKCFKLFATTDSADVDARDVERMLSQQYGWNVHVPPSSAAAGLQLIGARRCLYADGLIPHVMYRANGQDVSLYVLNGVTRNPSDLVTFGHRSKIWTRDDTTFVLVSPAEGAGGLADATRYVMTEVHR
ncbi:MAG TPA: zf-HC2 domain-containing protein [Vicinamibacterales bacterium]|nr:zf-HC2 domain-containing protein [Vicinamibacterales bacterium]